ncbi:MAG: DEAD/DEAH box helicase, partial [Spirochaetales bacterium]|nr:DEAD/DEAH box helicase [Spirochaetales bacterium]
TKFLESYEKHRYILLGDGTKGIVDQRLIQRLKRLLKPDSKGRLHISFFDLPLVEEFIDQKTASEGFLKSRNILEGFNTIGQQKLPDPDLRHPLREYQHKGYQWLTYLKKHQLGGCLADDMGLGKTIQAIALLATHYRENGPAVPQYEQQIERAGTDSPLLAEPQLDNKTDPRVLPSLVIMPKSLLLNWQREIEKFAPQLDVIIHHGTKRELEKSLTHSIILTTYHTARNEIKQLQHCRFAYIILDESQNIKNLASQSSKAMMLLSGHWRLALSGTPVENNLSELYALFRFLNPSMFGRIQDFRATYLEPITLEGDEQALSDLKTKIYPFILRRLKGEVLQELPEKVEQVIYVQMSNPHAAFYEKRREFYKEIIEQQIAQEGIQKARFIMLQAFGELRQLACIPESKSEGRIKSPKVELLGEYISETVSNGHKALVFANYLDALSLMEDELTARNITYLKMTGATRNRAEIVDAFQQDEQYQVLLMTLKTGGVGLNLTAADYVYIFDPWWNISAETQAVDRTHRIGQKNSVFSYKLITRGTIEEKILQLQQQKADLVSSLIQSDAGAMKQLAEEDIDFIFSSPTAV